MTDDQLKFASRLYMRFCVIFGEKFSKPYHDEAFQRLWYHQWIQGLTGLKAEHIRLAVEDCTTKLEWPPTLAQFRKMCERHAGVPSEQEALASIMRGDISHPVLALAKRYVGSWALRNDKQTELVQKFKVAYEDALVEFRRAPQDSWLALDDEKKKNALPPDNTIKFPSKEECKSFRENLKHWTDLALTERQSATTYPHPTWDEASVNPLHKKFDIKMYKERRSYLLRLDDISAKTLNSIDAYDRSRFIGEEIGAKATKKASCAYQGSTHAEKTSPRASNAVRRMNDWMMYEN